MTAKIQEGEFTTDAASYPLTPLLTETPVKFYDLNVLASNNPIEDSHAEAKLTIGGGLLFGIYDGHGGAACGQVGT